MKRGDAVLIFGCVSRFDDHTYPDAIVAFDAGRRSVSINHRDLTPEAELHERAVRAVVAAQWRDSFLWLHLVAMCRSCSIEALCSMLEAGLTFDLAEAEVDLPTAEQIVAATPEGPRIARAVRS